MEYTNVAGVSIHTGVSMEEYNAIFFFVRTTHHTHRESRVVAQTCGNWETAVTDDGLMRRLDWASLPTLAPASTSAPAALPRSTSRFSTREAR